MAAVPREPEHADADGLDPDADMPTEVVDRTPPPAPAPPAPAAPPPAPAAPAADPDADPDADFPTEVVDRGAPDGDDDGPGDDATFATIAIDRGEAAAPATAPAPGAAATSTPLRDRGRARRRGIAFPPVEPGFGREPVEAVGPGAVASYPVRALVEPPVAPAVESGPDATRAPAPAMPSVVRRSRRLAALTLGLLVAAVVVSAVGLTLLALLFFG